MLETALAVLFITVLFLVVFQVAHMVTTKILLDHAAARAARAKSVGFNEWMCLKSARVAMIPVAGRRLWPEEGEYDERSEERRQDGKPCQLRLSLIERNDENDESAKKRSDDG